tara:strand:+ start:907 stop:3156 length:2250 start_codon:yes stop_codon:yes gene_type:complete
MIRSYVKIKPIKDDGAFGANFNEVRKGINRTGSVTENIGNNLVETHKLIQFEKDWLRDKAEKEEDDEKDDEKESFQGFKRWFKGFRDMFRLQKREESTEDEELDKIEEEGGNFGQKTKETVKSGLELLGGFLTPIFKWVVTMGVLKWMSDPENAKKAEKVFKLIGAIAKFAWKIGKFGVGLIMAGLTKVFGVFDGGSTSPIKKGFKFVFGALQLFAGFKTLQYLLNPLKAVSDAKKLTTLFNSNAEKEVEFKKNEQWRKFGYKDRETGAIYTEKEYKAQKKSVERQQKKLRKQGRDQQAKQLGAKFNSRNNNPTRLQQGKNVGGKLMKPGAQGGLAIAGGLTRMASGIAMGEDKTEAVGAGLGQAAGGMLGAAAGTALLGPFLGPFAPIVGNAIGSFLGEWVGKTFLPMIKPLFEPIQKAFQMWWTIIKGVADETGITEFLGTFFKFLGQVGKVMFDILGWIMKPLTWLLGGAIKLIGKSISFIISAAKNIFAFMVNPIGFAWKIIRGKDPGKDVQLEEMSKGGALQAAFLSGYAEGGKYTMGYRMGQITPDQYVYNYQKFTSKTVVKGDQLIEQSKDFTELGGSIEVQDLIDHKEQLLSHPLLKAFKIADIINRKTGLPPEVLFPILMESDAQKATYKKMDAAIALDVKKMEAKFGKGKGWSWYDESFSEGGEFRSGTLSDSQIFEMTEKRDAMHDQFKYKNQRDNDAEMMMQAPIVITKQVTTPVINTKSSGHIIPVVASPSPMFTC